ncbi:MAG: AadA family aminoglycoside 3''-O-nucleotidyltransferase [Burkholderiaceae bacterium]
MNTSAPAAIARQLADALAVLERNLAGSLRAVHLFGSAVDGGLKPHSDIDLLVTVGAPLDEPVRRALMKDLMSISAWPGTDATRRALEVTLIVHEEVVPWRYPPLREMQFGEWLRHDLQAGRIEPATVDHDLAILLTKARKHSLNLLGPPASTLFDPVPVADLVTALRDTVAHWNEQADWQGDERNVVLALARIWFSLATGAIASKEAAAAWALERVPDEHRAVLSMARAAYLGSAADGLADRPERVAAFVRYARTVIERIRSGEAAGAGEASDG